MNFRPTLLVLLSLCMAFLAVVSGAQDDSQEMTKIKEQELEEVRERISELKKSMDRRAAERDRISGELQTAEVLIAEKRVHLQELERQRRVSEKKKADLDQKLKARAQELRAETEMLEDQVRAAYSSAGQERIKLLLNQLDPAVLGRQLAYYRYFSEFRSQNIEAVNGHIEELRQLRTEVAGEDDRLAGLTRTRYIELTELGLAQEKRQQLLVSLKSRIAKEGSEIERLAAQEQDLSRLIAELGSILADYPIRSEEPFSELKGRLTWPVAGGLVHDFGQPRAGGLNWNGVVLNAPRGREVRAVYHGRIVFADWLSGMGLLVIVDHGEGFMTLYGYNETLLKATGDWVAPGDVIATVGDSGGQSQASLYFEIRQGTTPVNPRRWITRSPRS
ncbi:MAG TPA: peptidoglycan DD-metalloendopeptidase family protein [Woeseiaceae bacterium]